MQSRPPVTEVPNVEAKKSTQTFFVQSFSTTLRVMDVRAENRGRPHQKVRFPAAPVVGRNFLTPGHSGVRVRNVRRKSGPKSLCLCCFFFPENGGQSLEVLFEVLQRSAPARVPKQIGGAMTLDSAERPLLKPPTPSWFVKGLGAKQIGLDAHGVRQILTGFAFEHCQGTPCTSENTWHSRDSDRILTGL